MAEFWAKPTRLFDGNTLQDHMAAHVVDGIVRRILPADDIPPDAAIRLLDGVLSPGFFDIQINGGGGVLFNTSPTPDGLETIGRAHHRLGTRHWMPTVITDAPEVLEAAVTAVLESHGRFGVAGLHIEGPHISHARRGTHNPAFIRPLDKRTLAQIDRLRAHNIPTLVTLAPEAVKAGDVAGLVRRGVTVSIGHTDADAGKVAALLDEGARLFTHLFNAMSQIENRAPNAVGTAINSRAYASIIADGHHVDLSILAMACRARPLADHMVLVTDAMPTVGGPDAFDLYGKTIRLVEGRLVNSEGSLAGAHTSIPEGIKHMAQAGIPLRDCLRMATRTPASALGMEETTPIGQMAGSRYEDLVLLGPDYSASAL